MRALPGALLAVFLATLSCAPARTPPPETVLVFWQSRPAGAAVPIVAEFERSHPGLRVRLERVPRPVGRAAILAAAAADSMPDLCAIGSDSMPLLLAGGRLADWSAGVADLRPQLRGWELCSVGEAIYGVPWLLDTRALFYDRTLFARARLDPGRPPGTWAELRRAAVAIHRLGHGVHGCGVPAGGGAGLARQALPYLFAGGGDLLSGDARRAVFDSAANVRALEFLLGLRRAGIAGDQDALEREFLAGRLGLLLAGPGLCARIRREAPGLRYGVALVPGPRPDSGASWAGGELLISFNDSKHKHLALDLARFLVQPENARRMAAAGRLLPATTGADTCGYYRARPPEAVMLRQLSRARFTPHHPAWPEMEAAIGDEMGLALGGGKSAAQAVKDAQARLAVLVGRH